MFDPVKVTEGRRGERGPRWMETGRGCRSGSRDVDVGLVTGTGSEGRQSDTVRRRDGNYETKTV